MKRIILASTSPRRKMLLEKTGLPFETIAGTYEEDMTLPLNPEELARELSKGKAESLAAEHADAVIIGADTFVAHNNKVIGKPHTPERAKEMLRELSGTTHQIITGVTIIEPAAGKVVSEAILATIYFKSLSDEEINTYVATGECLDKAGAYAIQGKGGEFVEKIEGDFDTIVGLPVARTVELLKNEFGIELSTDPL